MTERLPPIDQSLIDSYYTVAAHLRSNGESMLRSAEMLAQTADRMSEENARTDSASGDPHG